MQSVNATCDNYLEMSQGASADLMGSKNSRKLAVRLGLKAASL